MARSRYRVDDDLRLPRKRKGGSDLAGFLNLGPIGWCFVGLAGLVLIFLGFSFAFASRDFGEFSSRTGAVLIGLAILWFLGVALNDSFGAFGFSVATLIVGVVLMWLSRRVMIGLTFALFAVPWAGLPVMIANFRIARHALLLHVLGYTLWLGSIMAMFAGEAVFRRDPRSDVREREPDRVPHPRNEASDPQPSFNPAGIPNDAVFLTQFVIEDPISGPWPVTAGHTGSPEKLPVRLGGRVSPHGIGMHPPNGPKSAAASFTIGGNYHRFKGWVGLNDHRIDALTPVRFTIKADGKTIWESDDLMRSSPPVAFDVDVSGVERLTLETRTRLHVHAHAVWFEPHMLK